MLRCEISAPLMTAVGQTRRCRQRLSTAGLPSAAEELLPCQAVAKWQSPRTGNWGCKSAPNRAPIHNRSMPWMLLGNTGTAAEHEAEVEAGCHLADLVADVGPDQPRHAVVVQDERRPPVEPALPVEDARRDRPDADRSPASSWGGTQVTRHRHSHGPADESNKHLALFVASIPRPSQEKKKKRMGEALPWGVFGTAAAVAVVLIWVAYWTMLR